MSLGKRLFNEGLPADRVGIFASSGSMNTSNISSKDVILFPQPINNITRNNYSMSVWIKWDQLNQPDSNNGAATIMYLGKGTNSGLMMFWNDHGTYPNKPYISSDGGGFVSASTSLTAGWHHLVYVINSTAKIYIDGSLDVSASFTQGTRQYYDIIGCRLNTVNNNQQLFQGQMNDFRIFNREVTSSEVTTLYGETNGSLGNDPFSDSSCKCFINFEDNTNDQTGNQTMTGYNITYTNK